MPPKPTNTEDRRWVLFSRIVGAPGMHEAIVDIEPGGPIPRQLEQVEVMPVAEHKTALRDLEDSFKERVREALLGEKGRRIAAEAAYLDFEPTGEFDLLEEPLRMTWEGNTAAGIEAALAVLKPNGAEEVGDGVGAGVPQSKGSAGRSSEVKASAPAEGLFTASVDSVTTEQGAEGEEQVEAAAPNVLTPDEARLLVDASFGEAIDRPDALYDLVKRLGDWADSTQPRSETTKEGA